jgi:hypothetical protein
MSMINAQDCLRDLAKNKLSITKKALARLSDISQDVNVAYAMATGVPRAIDLDNSIFWSNDKTTTTMEETTTALIPNENWMLDFQDIWHTKGVADLLSSDEFRWEFG